MTRGLPCLRNKVGHILLRTRAQWEALIGVEHARSICIHARTVILPAEGSVQPQLDVLYDGLRTLETPALAPFVAGSACPAASKRRMVSDAEASDLLLGVQQRVVHRLKELSRSTPHLTESGINYIIADLVARAVVLGGWDKKLFSL